MQRSKGKGLVYVRITRFTESENESTLGVSGAVFQRVAHSKRDLAFNNRIYQTFRFIEEMDGVVELAITPRLIGVVKEDAAKWEDIVPTIEKILGLIFGNRLRLSKRNRRCVPDDHFGQDNLRSMRDAMDGCALTADEREAIYG